MQFLLIKTKCEELEKECIDYAKQQKAMHFYEKPPENGYRNVRFHVARYLHQFSTEDETKIRETVSKIVGCSIEDVEVNGYLYSSSFFLVLSIKEIYIEILFDMKQHDKEQLSTLSIDYFKDDFKTVQLEQTADKDKDSNMIDPSKSITESSKEYCIGGNGQDKLKQAEKPTCDKNSIISQWRWKNTLVGSRIGLQGTNTYGCVGFLVKSNADSTVPVTGFLTTATAVNKEYNVLYDENIMLSEFKRKTHFLMDKEAEVIVQYTSSNIDTPVGEVVESFIGNYKPLGSECAFGMDAAFVKSFNPYMGEIRPISTADDSTLTFDGTTVVIKRNKLTGDTYGVLISDKMSVAIQSPFPYERKYLFDNCFEVHSINKDTPFFSAGDSGSAVYVKGKNNILMPLGIAIASQPDGVTCVCRIDKIIQAFNVSIYQVEDEQDMETEELAVPFSQLNVN